MILEPTTDLTAHVAAKITGPDTAGPARSGRLATASAAPAVRARRNVSPDPADRTGPGTELGIFRYLP